MRVSQISPRGYKPTKEIQDIRFGQAVVYIDPQTQRAYTQQTELYPTQKEAVKQLNQVEKRMNNPHINYVSPTDARIDEKREFCSKYHRLSVYTPKPQEDLAQEIRKRIQQVQPFTTHELTNLFYDVILGLAHLQGLGIVHGKFRPEWVARSTTGYAIIDDSFMDPAEQLSLYRMRDYYLSPEAYATALRSKRPTLCYDILRSDVYSAGLVLLEAGLLEKLGDVYEDHDLNQGTVRQKLVKLSRRYPGNQLVVTTLDNMLNYDPEKRPDFVQIRNRIPDRAEIDRFFETEGDKPAVGLPLDWDLKNSIVRSRRSVNRAGDGVLGHKKPIPVESHYFRMRSNSPTPKVSTSVLSPTRENAAIRQMENLNFSQVKPVFTRPGVNGDLDQQNLGTEPDFDLESYRKKTSGDQPANNHLNYHSLHSGGQSILDGSIRPQKKAKQTQATRTRDRPYAKIFDDKDGVEVQPSYKNQSSIVEDFEYGKTGFEDRTPPRKNRKSRKTGASGLAEDDDLFEYGESPPIAQRGQKTQNEGRNKKRHHHTIENEFASPNLNLSSAFHSSPYHFSQAPETTAFDYRSGSGQQIYPHQQQILYQTPRGQSEITPLVLSPSRPGYLQQQFQRPVKRKMIQSEDDPTIFTSPSGIKYKRQEIEPKQITTEADEENEGKEQEKEAENDKKEKEENHGLQSPTKVVKWIPLEDEKGKFVQSPSNPREFTPERPRISRNGIPEISKITVTHGKLPSGGKVVGVSRYPIEIFEGIQPSYRLESDGGIRRVNQGSGRSGVGSNPLGSYFQPYCVSPRTAQAGYRVYQPQTQGSQYEARGAVVTPGLPQIYDYEGPREQ